MIVDCLDSLLSLKFVLMIIWSSHLIPYSGLLFLLSGGTLAAQPLKGAETFFCGIKLIVAGYSFNSVYGNSDLF
jgi:hypothetical protein